MKTKRLAQIAVLSAVALILFVVEAQIPALVPIPGIKLGIANIVTVFAVFCLGPKEGVLILGVRVFLGAVFSGQFSTIFYSAAGGALAILVTILSKGFLKSRQIWVAGCLGAIAHAVGQMAVAVLVTGTWTIAVYLPVMVACAIVTGLFTGLCAQLLVSRGDNLWKTFFK